MNNLPEWVQLIIAIVVIGCLPTGLLILIGNAKFFPVSLRTPLLVAGIMIVRKLNRVMPIKENIKDIAGVIFLASAVIFFIWAIKNKWLWNREL